MRTKPNDNGRRPERLERALNAALKRAPQDSKYADDARAIAKVVQRWHGDDAKRVLSLALISVQIESEEP